MTAWKVRAQGASGGMIADREELARGLRLLTDPKSGCEVVALSSGKFINRASTDIDGIIAEVDKLPNGIGIYVRLNPVPINLGRCAKKADISNRRWLYVDIDPLKPESEKDNPATDQEKEDAKSVGASVNEYLESLGWPAPVVLESGNGCALLYRVELEATAGIQSLYRKFLLTLQNRFADQPGVIDGSVHDATRLIKLPGTWARKGQCTDDRPYRPCRIVFAPVDQVIVSAAMIESACEEEKKQEKASAFTVRATSGGAGSYGRAALDAECARVAMGRNKNRNNDLNRAAFSLFQLVAGEELTEDEVVSRLTAEALLVGLEPDETAKTLASARAAGMAEPRKAPEKEQPKPAATAIPEGESIIYWASTVTPKKVEWLWPGRIPLGKLTTFAGVGGLGKTFVLCDITARITSGLGWPDDEKAFADKGKVLFISGEDEPDDTLVPRMIEMGADLKNVAFLKTEVQDRFTMRDLPTLERALNDMRGDTRFVAIDPPTAYLGDVNDHNNAELRGLLTPLKSWAAKRNVSIVFNTHVNKGGSVKLDAMMRVMGSVAWVNAVRAAHMFARDPEDATRRLFIGMKNNLGKEIKGLAYTLESVGDLAKVKWLGEVDTTADEAVNKEGGTRKRKVDAEVWLAEMFDKRNRIASNEIKSVLKTTILSWDTISDAKGRMGIYAKQDTDEQGDRVWFWFWNEDRRRAWKEQHKEDDESEEEPEDQDTF